MNVEKGSKRPLLLKLRLMKIADTIPPGSRVADIGTDHARLPAYLLQRGITEHIIATDISDGPLIRAKRTLGIHGLDRIQLRKGFGAQCVEPSEVDVVVISGMGADTIMEILQASPWLKEKHLFLQPMTKQIRLYNYLLVNGYPEPKVDIIQEEKRKYTLYSCGGTI